MGFFPQSDYHLPLCLLEEGKEGYEVAVWITINVPVVYLERDIMILMRANPFRGPLEGVGPPES